MTVKVPEIIADMGEVKPPESVDVDSTGTPGSTLEYYDIPGNEGCTVRTREELEAKLEEGYASLERGEGIVITPEYFEQLHERLRTKYGVSS